MIPIIYETGTTAFGNNGLGRLRDCVSCVVTEERNGIYEIDFEYPVDGANFDLIECGRIVGATHDDNGDIQPFDIVSYSKPLNGIVTFHGVHVSYRLNGAVTYAKNVNSLSAAFTKLDGQSPSPFTFDADFSANAYVGAFDGVPKTVRQYLGGVEGSILDTFGGEYEFDKWAVTLKKSRGEQKDFAIRYGVNLLDYNDETDYSETFNYAVPYWIGDNGKGVEVCVVASPVDSGEQTFLRQPIEAPLDLSEKFEDKPTTTQLRNEASAYMSSNHTSEPQKNITVDFVRLQDYTDFEDMALLMSCGLCDSIKVIFPRYGENRFYKIVKTVYNTLKDRYDEMELGSLSTSLADALGIGGEGSMGGGDVLSELTKVTTESIPASLNAGSYWAEQTTAISNPQSGYEAVGIVGVKITGNNSTFINLAEFIIDGSDIKWKGRNVSSAGGNWSGTLDFKVLWIKASS